MIYTELLSYVFKRFSVLSARRTALPTAWYYLRRPALPASDKPALFTMNIYPPMMTVWHHCVKKYLKDDVDVTIFDCSGQLDAREFPGARVQKFLNLYAATKSQEFLDSIARNRKTAWICDDDVFPISHECIDVLKRELSVPNTASVSFKPRTAWRFAINGKEHEPSGSYCLGINREIVMDKERLDLGPCNGNVHKQRGRYDTWDKANETLLQKGYRCLILPEEERDRCVASFTGLSGAVMLLHYYRTPEQLMEYFETPPDNTWSGNVLYGLLCALIAADKIQELYTKLKGHPYPLKSLPTREYIQDLRRRKQPLLLQGRNFDWVDEAGKRLERAI